jgi:3-hydroxyisobutyrate dehydrogenase-like beta-hydroxyacid dehydrogenase
MTRVCVLGLGEAGSRLAADLVAAGVDVHGFDPAVAGVPEGVVQFPDAVSAVTGARAVLSLTTAAVAVAAAESVVSALESEAVYADLNTSSPALKREIAGVVAAGRGTFADVALLGAVPARGLRTPALASGPGAGAFATLFRSLGMPVEVVSAEPGDAAAMKLLRSVFMKGLAAAAIESTQAAGAAGHPDWLRAQLADVIGQPLLERLLEGSRTHAARRVEEMEAASELLRELGIEPHVANASAAVLSELARDADATRDPGSSTAS